MARKSKLADLYVLDPLAPFKASQMPGKKKGGPNYHSPGATNFLKHKGTESRWFDYEMLSHLGQVYSWEQWIRIGTKAVESYPNYGSKGGTHAPVSAQRMLGGMRKEGFLIKVK